MLSLGPMILYLGGDFVEFRTSACGRDISLKVRSLWLLLGWFAPNNKSCLKIWLYYKKWSMSSLTLPKYRKMNDQPMSVFCCSWECSRWIFILALLHAQNLWDFVGDSIRYVRDRLITSYRVLRCIRRKLC